MQAIVLNDVAYTEVVRLEVLGTRKIGENPVLATREFEVRTSIIILARNHYGWYKSGLAWLNVGEFFNVAFFRDLRGRQTTLCAGSRSVHPASKPRNYEFSNIPAS